MELRDFIDQVDNFDKLPPREKIRVFAWFLHAHRSKETFDGQEIRSCFSQLHIADPNVAKYLSRMVEYGDLIVARGMYKLERSMRNALDASYGAHQSVVQVSKLLAELPSRVPDIAEKDFLLEAIKCYRVEAYRSCVVMTWNLAYSHVLRWLLKDSTRLVHFNAAIARRYPKRASLVISDYDDFLDELKESEVIEICNTAGVLSSNVVRVLKEKLGKRNIAAHPSTIVIVQSQADDVVTDLVNNVVVALA